jgi:DNA-directed RNA polymerase specialized sigma24 family protein
LTTDERTLAANLFEAHAEEVVACLERSSPSVDPEVVHDAFVLALLELAQDPAKFDADRGASVGNFLYGAALRRLGTLLRSGVRRRRRDKEKSEILVAQRPSAARSILDLLADAEDAERIRRQVAQTDAERQVLRLWELGCGDAEIAEQLNMNLPIARQVRDRLIHRLRRLGQNEAESR